MESYLTRSYKLRIILAKFRLSSHCLAIEKGRHTKPKTICEDRVCWLCKKNRVKDKSNFLVGSNIYEEERCVFYASCNFTPAENEIETFL